MTPIIGARSIFEDSLRRGSSEAWVSATIAMTLLNPTRSARRRVFEKARIASLESGHHFTVKNQRDRQQQGFMTAHGISCSDGLDYELIDAGRSHDPGGARSAPCRGSAGVDIGGPHNAAPGAFSTAGGATN